MKNNLLLRKRGNYDELYTPKYAVKPILKYLKQNSKILCPFDDWSSEYVKVLKNNGHNVVYSHEWDNKNFFDYQRKEIEEIDYIISNPPYSIKDKVLEKLYELNKPFAMLLPITTLEGIKRNKLFNKYGIEIMVLDKRINFMEEKKKSSYFNTSYFCHKILPKQLVFEKVEK